MLTSALQFVKYCIFMNVNIKDRYVFYLPPLVFRGISVFYRLVLPLNGKHWEEGYLPFGSSLAPRGGS